MAEKFILAHDLGTTGDKATLFDESGRPHASAFAAYPTDYPRPNWAEQNPEDWWRAFCTTTAHILASAHIAPQEVAAVSFSGQMMGCVPVDQRARPLRNAIIWADTRAVEQARALIERVGMAEAYRITGHRASSSYSGPKIMWLRDHQPEVFAQTHQFLQAKDFLVARLTGRFVTDYSDASGTNLYDLQAHDWSPALLEAAGIDRERLPELHASTDVVGEVVRTVVGEAGLAPGTPVVIGGGDGACASAGAGVVRDGSAYTYLGSSAWIGIASRQPVYDPSMRTFTFAHLVPGLFTPLGTMQSAGGAYQWLRDNLCLPEKDAAAHLNLSPYELMNLQAMRSTPGAGGLLFLPYLLGERSPRWNPDARAVFLGLTMSHTRADMVRAVLEGITLNLRVILEAFRDQGVAIQAMRVIGGGVNSAVWRQIMADIYGLPIQRLSLTTEATSFGAALAGGVGVGIYSSFDLAMELAPVMDVTHPNAELEPLYNRLYGLFNHAYDALVPIYAEMADFSSMSE